MAFQEIIMKDRFLGRVAIVTGAGSGIGKEIALRFAREGAAVVVPDINFDAARETVEMIEGMDAPALALKVDVGNVQDIKMMVSEAVSAYGRIDILVNNAGTGVRESLMDTADDAWARVLAVNVTGTGLCIKYVVPEMRKVGGGKIVNISSMNATIGAGLPVYTASKGAIISMSRTIAVELAPLNINVVTLVPGPIATPINESLRQLGLGGAIAEKIPRGQWGTPKDVAAVAAFLCSDEADFITGSMVYVDGGLANFLDLGKGYREAYRYRPPSTAE